MGRKRKIDNMININESSNSSGTSFSYHQNSSTSLSNLQRSAANDRERTRMRVLSKAFVKLKTSLPWVPADTKLSKLDTLKLATSYISYLTHILQDDENNDKFNSTEIFQKAGVNLQKFNLTNTRLFSGNNVRFSHTDKHKKIIENLTAAGLTTPSINATNNFNSNSNNVSTTINTTYNNAKIMNVNSNHNGINGFNLCNYPNDYVSLKIF
jgi:hypothetical protein